MIQVFGSQGTLGRAVCVAAKALGLSVIADQRNITVIKEVSSPVVINCAGIVKQRQENPSRFVFVNSYAPHLLAELCDQSKARLVHISTDCVFCGTGPHSECDLADARDIYALSKLTGEIYRAPHVTIRTSFVGLGERGLIADLLSKGATKASNRLLWSGHTVATVASLIVSVAMRHDVTGLLHIPGEFQTRLQLVQALADKLKIDLAIERDDGFVADRRLVSNRWDSLGLPRIPTFQEQLEKAEL